MNEITKRCFNCIHSDKRALDAGVPSGQAICFNDDVEINLFNLFDEYALPDYCQHYKEDPVDTKK